VRSHTAAEAGADYDEVEIEPSLLAAGVDGIRSVRFAGSIP